MFPEKIRKTRCGFIFLSVFAIIIVLCLQVSVLSKYLGSLHKLVVFETASKPNILRRSSIEEKTSYPETLDELRSHVAGEDGIGALVSSELLNVQRSHVGGEDGIKALISPETEKRAPAPRKIILWSSWRSGSTFLGDLLAKAEPEQTFYSFEPLYEHGMEVFSDPSLNKTKAALRLIHDLLLCDLTQHQDFVRGNAALHFPLAANRFFQMRCAKVDKCGDNEFFSESCALADLHVAKIVRLSLRLARQFLLDPDMADLQIVYLVRDPRPVMRSRLTLENRRWCQPNTEDCSNPSNLCQLVEDDLQQIPQLLQDFPDRFFFLKYEDLSLNSSQVISQLWDSLHIPLTNSFMEYLNKTTRGEKPKEQRINSSRQTLQHTFEWRNTIEWPLVQRVQDTCWHVIKQLGWRVFDTEEELRNVSLSMDMQLTRKISRVKI